MTLYQLEYVFTELVVAFFFCFTQNIQKLSMTSHSDEPINGTKTTVHGLHNTHTKEEQHTPPLFCLQQLLHGYCFLILFFSSFFLFNLINLSLLNYFHLKNVFGVDSFLFFTALIWYVNGNDDGIHVWLSFKTCVYTFWQSKTMSLFPMEWLHFRSIYLYMMAWKTTIKMLRA